MSLCNHRQRGSANLSLFLNAVIWGLIFSCFIHFAAPAAESPRLIVRKCEIVNEGPVNFDVSLARSLILVKAGEPFQKEQISTDIQRLFQSNYFRDVVVDVYPLPPDGVRVVYRLVARVRVEDILIHGNRVLSEKKILKDMLTRKSNLFSPADFNADLQMLYEKYRKKGYVRTLIRYYIVDARAFRDLVIRYLAQAGKPFSDENTLALLKNPQFRRELTGISRWVAPKFPAVTIVLDIQEQGLQVITGVTVIDDDNPEETFDPGELSDFLPLQTQWSFFGNYADDALIQQDAETIVAYFHDRGYLDCRCVRIEKKLGKTWLRRRPGADIIFHIRRGEQYRIRSINITGNHVFPKERIMALLRMHPGDVWQKVKWEKAARRIRNLYGEKGYLNCNVAPRVIANPQTHTVQVTVTISEGKSYRIRNINILGNTITRDYVIRRELPLHPGDLAHPEKIRLCKTRLQNLGYFENVDVYTVDTDDGRFKDLYIRVEEKDTGRLSFSVAISDTSSPTFRIELGQSNFDIFGWRRKFRGGGQRFQVSASVGDEYWGVRFHLTEPWLFQRRLRMDLDFWRTETSSLINYQQTNLGGQVKFLKKLPFPYLRGYLGYRRENIRLSDFDSDYSPELIAEEEGTWNTSNILTGLAYDSRDSYYFPTKGILTAIDLAYGDDFINSYADILRTTLRYDWYLPLLWRNVLRLRTRIGSVHRIHGDENPKMFDRFFLGGGSSLRGFKANEVGPYDPANDEPIGGRSMLLLSAELLTPLYKKTLYSAIFFDAGNVWAGSHDWAFDELNMGTGLGIRIRLPIGGALSIDYAWPVRRQDERLDDSGRIHFNLGYTF